MTALTAPSRTTIGRWLGRVAAVRRSISRMNDPAKIVPLIAEIDTIEKAMERAGFTVAQEELRPVNETRFEARWALGRLLKKAERHPPGPIGKKDISRPEKYLTYLREIGLDKSRAYEAERIGSIPDRDLLREHFEEMRKQNRLNTVRDLLLFSKHHWHKEKRAQKHRDIAEQARENAQPETIGPFPLVYLDPPWVFETYTPDNTHRMPDDHYPTLTDEQIINFQIGEQGIPEIAADTCAIFMWCTSSNIARALQVLKAWDFEYKTQAVWDKVAIGLGLIFRNQHEVLLYASRGDPPKPITLYPSVFRFQKTTHSAKPPEIRTAIETMYPFFDDPSTKIELFAREQYHGWTCVGFEANRNRDKGAA